MKFLACDPNVNSMKTGRFWVAVLAMAAAGTLSCGRGLRSAGPERLAILRFENLGADVSEDWMGRALEEVVTEDLSHAREISAINAVRIHMADAALGARPVSDPGISAERQAALAAGATRLGYGTYRVRAGRLDAQLSIEDVRSRRMARVLSASAAGGDVIAVGGALAVGISSHSTAYSTRSIEAVREFAQAMELGDSARAAPHLRQAIAADPNFGPAYRLLSQFELQQRDRSGARGTLEQALARGAQVNAIERARIAIELATVENEPQLRLRALNALVKLDPNDRGAWRVLAGLALARHEYGQSAEAYRRVLEGEPNDLTSWNDLGYASAFQGDLETARSAERHYQSLRPTEANPLDSLGDVNFMCGRFREAQEAYLQAAAKDPNFHNNGEFFKAAVARLYSGDVAGADALAERYRQARAAAHDALVDFRKAQWAWLSGRRKEACRQMEAFARGALNDVAPHAWAELTVWSLMLGDREAAAGFAEKTLRAATAGAAGTGTPGASAGAGGLALITGFLVEPPVSAGEWEVRAEQTFPNPQQGGMRSLALTSSLLFAKEYGAAAALLKQAYENGPSAADQAAPVLLAWTYMETGRATDAARLLKTTPTPSANGSDAFLSFSFPRIEFLRGEQAALEGKRDEARAHYRLFLQLSGPDPLMWGEEQKARAGL